MSFALKQMDSVLQIMNFVLKMTVLMQTSRMLPEHMFLEVPKDRCRAVTKDDLQAYRFSIAMVEMAYAICAGRSQTGLQLFLKTATQFKFTYQSILSKIQAKTPVYISGWLSDDTIGSVSQYDVRRVYIKAMWAMYCDREYAGMVRQTRQRTRIWEGIDMNKLKKMRETAKDMEGVTAGYKDLREALHAILVDCAGGIDSTDTQKNEMLLESLGLMQFIIRQGHYDPREVDSVDDGVLLLGPELKDLVSYLVKLMDGRDDTGFVDARRRKECDPWELEMLMKPGSTARFEVNQENRIVFRIKTTCLEILNDLLDISASSRVDYCMKTLAKAKADAKQGRFSRAAHRPASEEMKNPLSDGAAAIFEQEGVATFEQEESGPSTFETEDADGISPVDVLDTGAPPPDDRALDLNDRALDLNDRALDLNAEENDEDDDGTYDKKTRKIAKAAIKADTDNKLALSMFSDTDEEKIEQILLDNLRYSQNEDLVLSSFAALAHYKGAGARFHELLTTITLVTNPEDAELFLVLYALVTEFRKSIARLLEKSWAQQCMASCENMANQCKNSATARTLLRNIGVDRFIGELLLEHQDNVHTEVYMDVLEQALLLVSALCHDTDQFSQVLLADMLESVFMPLLRGGPTDGDPPPTYERRKEISIVTARIIPHIFVGNRALSMSFSSILTEAVAELTQTFGKSAERARILLGLVQVDGKSVEVSQSYVSKGFVEKSGLALDGRLMQGEWGEGPGMEFMEVIEKSVDEDSSNDRADQELSYYCILIEIISKCARGLMPHCELQAASKMSFDECMDRILMFYQHLPLKGLQQVDDLTNLKRLQMMFLIDVFLDSDSEFTQAVVHTKMNGMWTMPPRDHESRGGVTYTPLTRVLLDDIKQLDGTSSQVFRRYVCEEITDFFVLFCVSAPNQFTSPEDAEFLIESELVERQTMKQIISQVRSAAVACLKRLESASRPLTRTEEESLQRLNEITTAWCNASADGDPASSLLPPHYMESFRRSGGYIADRAPPEVVVSDVETLWKCFVTEFEGSDLH